MFEGFFLWPRNANRSLDTTFTGYGEFADPETRCNDRGREGAESARHLHQRDQATSCGHPGSPRAHEVAFSRRPGPTRCAATGFSVLEVDTWTDEGL